MSLFNAERQAGKLRIPIFMIFDLTRRGTEPESTISVADARIYSATDRSKSSHLCNNAVPTADILSDKLMATFPSQVFHQITGAPWCEISLHHAFIQEKSREISTNALRIVKIASCDQGLSSCFTVYVNVSMLLYAIIYHFLMINVERIYQALLIFEAV